MRISPQPPRIPSDQPPTEADQAQAAATAQVLAGLIGDREARLATLAAEAAEAAADGALQAARAIHAKSLEVRRELDALQMMEHRLVRRFFAAAPTPLAALPSA